MTTRRFVRAASDDSGRSFDSVVMWGFALLIVGSVLACLPAFHGLTDLHHGGETLDAFDLGISVPETTKGSLSVVVLGALLVFTGLRRQTPYRPLGMISDGQAARSADRPTVWTHLRLKHLVRRNETRGSVSDGRLAIRPAAPCSVRRRPFGFPRMIAVPRGFLLPHVMKRLQTSHSRGLLVLRNRS